MSENSFYDSLEEDNQDASVSENKEEVQMPIRSVEKRLHDKSAKSAPKSHENAMKRVTKRDSNTTTVPICIRSSNTTACNNVMRRLKRKPNSKIPILTRKFVFPARSSLLPLEFDKNNQINEWLKDVEKENTKRSEEIIKNHEVSVEEIQTSMKNMKLEDSFVQTDTCNSRTFLSLHSQNSMFARPRRQHSTFSSWSPPIRQRLSYLGQYRLKKQGHSGATSLIAIVDECHEDKLTNAGDANNSMQKDVLADAGEKEDNERDIDAVKNFSCHGLPDSETVVSALREGPAKIIGPVSYIVKDSQQVHKSRNYVPYSINDYRRLPIPRLGTLGPDLEACREKLDRMERQRAYGQRVSSLNRQKVVLQLKREKLLRARGPRPPDTPPPALCTARPRSEMARPSENSPRSGSHKSGRTTAVALRLAGPVTAAATVAFGVAPGGRRERGRAPAGRPPPAPRRHRPSPTDEETARRLREMLERHRREVEEKQAIRRQMDAQPPPPLRPARARRLAPACVSASPASATAGHAFASATELASAERTAERGVVTLPQIFESRVAYEPSPFDSDAHRRGPSGDAPPSPPSSPLPPPSAADSLSPPPKPASLAPSVRARPREGLAMPSTPPPPPPPPPSPLTLSRGSELQRRFRPWSGPSASGLSARRWRRRRSAVDVASLEGSSPGSYASASSTLATATQ